MPKEYLNPPELFNSQQYGFSQIVTSRGGKTVYLSGQVGWDAQQQMVGPDDPLAQTRQTLRNIETAMHIAGGALSDVVSMRIYIVDDVIADDSFMTQALLEFFPKDQLPATTWIGVKSLANKDFLVEIEAIGVIEE
ncbi:MAG: RidA family protein [Caldilineaceae bacterium]|nr:RidA family protein [Caldilineaceae bacterium]